MPDGILPPAFYFASAGAEIKAIVPESSGSSGDLIQSGKFIIDKGDISYYISSCKSNYAKEVGG
jgi:hypothetical protein